MFPRQLQYFFEGVDCVLATDRISLVVSNVIIRSQHYFDGVLGHYKFIRTKKVSRSLLWLTFIADGEQRRMVVSKIKLQSCY
jgi:hypothetical protein